MPSTERLKKYLEQLCPLPARDWELLGSLIQRRVFKRKEQILRAGEIEDYVSYIDRGIVRYYVEEDDKDITFEIAFENSLAAGYDSFLTRTPVLYNAEALVDTELWSVD
jgi:CRP-like cAMP-binding protein